MRILRAPLNRLSEARTDSGAAVVIDVLRSFSTAAYALAAGADAVYPVATVSDAFRLRERLGDALLVGALGGGMPVPGFDCGNSPGALDAHRIQGRPLILHTAAGVQGLIRCRNSTALFAAALVCARATARAILAESPGRLLIITTGEWVDRDGDEDIACADYLEALLRGERPAPEAFERRVRESDFGRRFVDGGSPHLPPRDLADCSAADRFDFALRVENDHGVMRLRPLTAGETVPPRQRTPLCTVP